MVRVYEHSHFFDPGAMRVETVSIYLQILFNIHLQFLSFPMIGSTLRMDTSP